MMMQTRNSLRATVSPQVTIRQQFRLRLNLGTAFLIGVIPTIALIYAHFQAVG